MKIKIPNNTKLEVKSTTNFNKEIKRVFKQGKDISKLENIVTKIANEELLEEKYRDHQLNDTKRYKGCRECHIEPEWLLVYKIINNELILILIDTGSHSGLF